MQLKAGYWYRTRDGRLAYVAFVWPLELAERFGSSLKWLAVGAIDGSLGSFLWDESGGDGKGENSNDLVEEIGPNPPIEMVAGHFYETNRAPVHIVGQCPFTKRWIGTTKEYGYGAWNDDGSPGSFGTRSAWTLIRDLGPELPEAAQ